MPTYEYLCNNCKHSFEEFQKMTEAPLINCPKCHQDTVSKLVSASGFQLKGTGWYVTDYSKKNKSTDPKPEGSKSEKSEPAADKSKGDATSSAKIETKSSSGSGAKE